MVGCHHIDTKHIER